MAKKETAKQRRARLIREHVCTACGKRKARKKDGEWLTECQICSDYYAEWAAKHEGKAKKAPARKRKAAPKKVRRPHVLGSNPVAVKEITTGAADLLGVSKE